MSMKDSVKLCFDFYDENNQPEQLCFSQPIKIFTAHQLSEVRPVLQNVESWSRSGYYAAGFLSYEAAPAFDDAYQVCAQQTELPLAWFAIFADVQHGHSTAKSPQTASINLPNQWRPSKTEQQFADDLDTIRRLIEAGETYQMNYTYRLHTILNENPQTLYEYWKEQQNCPYAAYLEFPGWRLLSFSPELFFRTSASRESSERILLTKPMKGTAEKGRWLEETLYNRDWLKQSEKNRAENLMIVDLLRNDMSRICKIGSVHVPVLFEIEEYPTVWQMTSTICGNLQPNVRLEDIFSALFPCGSITGAPKIQTMRRIAELEAEPRGVYCGAIGYVKPGGDALFNVAIRTVTLHQEGNTWQAEYGVGGGITIDSTPTEEWRETQAKTAFLRQNRSPFYHKEFALLETLLLQDGQFVLLEEHMERLRSSAAFFHFPLPEERILADLHSLSIANFQEAALRVRLTVDAKGGYDINFQPTERMHGRTDALPNPESTRQNPVLKIMLAQNPVDSTNLFLYHKTTYRNLYQVHVSTNPNVLDTLLWNERGEVTEFTIGNLVVWDKGRYWTPHRHCGLLAGTLRQHLLKRGLVEESVLTLDDVLHAEHLWFINSVRGWRKVEICKNI
ncbi:para-aminobenzoate synthetase/4-amino-4-deoxychorismate lyase [Alicyclobacillus tengchongensis]|uniref:Para-aminobenzoate synthetase/4-amino-4-deoxychorismate lyase n=2 Tax=Alicyclobacillus tolerans TaxID=90970 RepID=A0ABT9LV12_9BACL|nr:para-aminobenzoate synthetase/4-amino-4-deoxychorismate lyase [Alicyclobacillus tengchongensis]